MNITELDPAKFSVSISGNLKSTAHQASITAFDLAQVEKYNTTLPRVIYESLEDNFGGFEKQSGLVADAIMSMSFADGSSISVKEICVT